jgi:major membrane immunogen (membrane-anchored lipoprotein)
MASLATRSMLNSCVINTASQAEKSFKGEKTMISKKNILLGIVMSLGLLLLAACSNEPSAKANFPTGKFVQVTDEFQQFNFNNDGTWMALVDGEIVAQGTYGVNGDTYTEKTNDQDCPSPMSFQYTYDGAYLKFHLTDQSKKDTCPNRMNAFNDTTYIAKK